MEIRACVFDYGNTLAREKGFDCLAGMRNIMTEVIENPYNVTAEQLVELSEQLDDYMGRREGYIKKFGTVEYPEMISLKYIFDYYGLKFSTSLEEIEYMFWEGCTESEEFADTTLMLKKLQENNIALAVVSNNSFSSYSLERRLNVLFPEIKFDYIYSSATCAFRKPDIFVYRLIERKLEIESDKIIFIGDRKDTDIEGANDAGFKSLKIGSDKSDDSKEGVIESWKEFLNQVELTDGCIYVDFT